MKVAAAAAERFVAKSDRQCSAWRQGYQRSAFLIGQSDNPNNSGCFRKWNAHVAGNNPSMLILILMLMLMLMLVLVLIPPSSNLREDGAKYGAAYGQFRPNQCIKLW